jgi:O-antigen/teichoic acid export membrane protein
MQKKIIKDTFFLNAASIINQVLAMLQSLIVLRLLNPESYGIWLSLGILLTYGTYVSFGLEHGIALRLPYYQGLKNHSREAQMQDTAYVSWTIMTILYSLGILVYTIWFSGPSPVLKSGLFVISCLVIIEQQVSFFGRWSTAARKDFFTHSRINILRGVFSFCIVVPLVYFFNVYGIIFGSLIVSSFTLMMWRTKTAYRFSSQLSSNVLLELFRIGFPMFMVVLGGSLIETVDRLTILSLLGSASLGHYGIVTFGGNSLYGMLKQAGSAMSPHIVEEVGKNNGSLIETKKYLIKPTIIFSSIISIFIIGLVSVMPVLVNAFLPKYILGLPAFWLYVPGFFFLSIILTANNIFTLGMIARGKQYITILIQLISILIEVGVGVTSIKIGWGITGVAFASTLSYAFYGLSILFMATRYVGMDVNEQRRFLFLTLIPIVYVIFVLSLLYQANKWIALQNIWISFAISTVLGTITAAPLVYWLGRQVDFFSYVRSWASGLIAK